MIWMSSGINYYIISNDRKYVIAFLNLRFEPIVWFLSFVKDSFVEIHSEKNMKIIEMDEMRIPRLLTICNQWSFLAAAFHLFYSVLCETLLHIDQQSSDSFAFHWNVVCFASSFINILKALYVCKTIGEYVLRYVSVWQKILFKSSLKLFGSFNIEQILANVWSRFRSLLANPLCTQTFHHLKFDHSIRN